MSSPRVVVHRISPTQIRVSFEVCWTVDGRKREERHHFDFSLELALAFARALESEACRTVAP